MSNKENHGQQETLEVEKSLPEEVGASGEIRINHSVIASIVRLSALEVSGVAAVGGRFMDGVAEIFSKKESDRGVVVRENEEGDYVIDIRVLLFFGHPLTEVALAIQQNVMKQISFMTQKQTAQINVIIDGVKVAEGQDEKKNQDVISID